MSKNVRLLRLLTGEEIIAEVTRETAVELTIKNPIRILLIPASDAQMKNGNPTVAFAPWMQFTKDDTVSLKKDHVLVNSEPLEQFLEQYNRTFGNIIMPPKGLMLPE